MVLPVSVNPGVGYGGPGWSYGGTSYGLGGQPGGGSPNLGAVNTGMPGGAGGVGYYGAPGLQGVGAYNPYGSPNFLSQFKPQWNIATPYDPMIATAKQYLYTPQQMRGIANQQASAQINAQLGATNASYNQQLQYLGAMQNRSAGLAQALGDFGPGYAAAIQNIYDRAAQTQAAVGGGVVDQGTGAMQQSLDAAKQAVADKTGGQGQVSSYDPNALGATLQTTGVQMPGNALAVGGANAAQMALWGANADKAQAQNVVNYYTQQATQALQQRTAARAQIIAQQPQLFQQALEATRQDNYQTQNRIDSLVSNSQQYIMNRNQMRMNQLQNINTWWLSQVSATHVNPFTGQPVGGYTWADKAHTIAVPFKDLALWKHQQNEDINTANKNAITQAHYNDLGDYYRGRVSAMQQAADAKSFAAQQPGKFDPRLSAYLKTAVDSQGRPLVDANGKPIPYQAPKKQPTPLTVTEQAKLFGPMGQSVQDHATGVAATAKTAAIPQFTAPQMIDYLNARGWFGNRVMGGAALNALATYYHITPEMVNEYLSGKSVAWSGLEPYGPPSGTSTSTPGGKKGGGKLKGSSTRPAWAGSGTAPAWVDTTVPSWVGQ
jgi:hypothetical protein